MGITSRNKKRLLIFAVVPILLSIFFFVDDIILKSIAFVITLVYVGFIIFLRDSVSDVIPFGDKTTQSDEPEDETDGARNRFSNSGYDTDDGEEFKIVSQHKNLDVITADTYTPDSHQNRKSYFKPPDLKENFDKIATEELPANINQNEQFGFVLERLLNVIKDAFMAHTALFFWYNKKKNRLTLERFVSGSSEITKQKFDIEDDILSKIVTNEEPELLTEISPNAEQDVIRYYNFPAGIKSFVGAPLFYKKQLYGILAMDSKEGDAFGIETIYSLGRAVRIISVIIALFEEKHTESIAEQRLDALLGVLAADKRFSSEKELYNTLETAVRTLLPWDAFTFVYYFPEEQKFKTTKIVNNTSLKYIGEHLEIEITGTLVGKAVMSGMPVKIDDTSASDFVRFAKTEDVTFDGSFLAIPLIYDDQSYGVLCFESLKKNMYTNNDVRFMKSATKMFSFILYSFSNQNLFKSLLSVDIETRALNLAAFKERLSIELAKTKELEAPGAVALIKIDDFLEQESLFEGDPFPKVLKSVVHLIKSELTPLNLFGRLDDRVFAIHFFNSSSKDVFLWAEKLRIKIARKPIAVISKQTTFTVSIGVASTNNKSSVDEALHNAELALNKAIEKGGNSVKSIS